MLPAVFKGDITKELITTKTEALEFESPVAAVATASVLENIAKQLRALYSPEIEVSDEYRGVKVAVIPTTTFEIEHDEAYEALKKWVEAAEEGLKLAKANLSLREKQLVLDGKATEVKGSFIRVTIPK